MCASICQSCATPLENELDFGTNTDKTKNRDFCQHCFRDGEFTNPKATIKEVIEISAKHMALHKNMHHGTALQYMENTLPRLKRWRGEQA